MRRLGIVEKAKKRFGGYSQMDRHDDAEAWLGTVQCQSAHTDTRCTHEPSEATKIEKHSIKAWFKSASTALMDSDAGLRLREQVHQISVYSISSTESHLLGDVLHRIMINLAKRSEDLCSTVQSMDAIMNGFEVQLQRVFHSGCPALQRVYAGYADSEDAMGPHITPRSAPTWLDSRQGSRASFGATSWYIFHAACPRAGQKKALEFGIKVGVTVEAANQYGREVLPGTELNIESLTPAMVSDLIARLSSRSCLD